MTRLRFGRVTAILGVWGILATAGLAPGAVHGQDTPDEAEEPSDGMSLPMEATRSLGFNLDQGSWMSVDVSPDGSTLVFDLLGKLYTMPVEGGEARALTSGMAFDRQPRFSPDGTSIVFVSDRSGGQNVWTLGLDSGEFHQITRGNDNLYTSPTFTPEGDYVIVSRARGPLGNTAKLWMFHLDGGTGVQLIREPNDAKTLGAAVEPGTGAIWFAQRTGDWEYDAMFPIYQLGALDRITGETTVMSSRYGSAFRPTFSPDGRWLVFGTRHDGATGLRIRDLDSGQERWLAYPVQRDDKESRATMDVLPGMAFTPDSRELLTSWGGRLWRVPVDAGPASEIPFRVNAEVALGPLLEFEYPVDDSPTFPAGQIRDATLSPDGDRIAFTALNRLYVADYPDGPPRALTDGSVGEHAPIWSPDGSALAFLTWSDDGGSEVRRVEMATGALRTLAEGPGLFRQLAWAPDGRRLVALRGPSEELLASPLGTGTDLVEIPADGGTVRRIALASGRHSPHFSSDPERIFAYSPRDGLVSFRWDGTDVRAHLRVTGIVNPRTGNPAQARAIHVSPDGRMAIAHVLNDLYLITIPEVGGAAPTVSVADPSRASVPARRLTDVGGDFPEWRSDGRAIAWSLGNVHFTYDLGEAPGWRDDAEEFQATEQRIEVEIERDLPMGIALLRGARLVTMVGEEVIPDGEILVQGHRIAAVGPAGSLDVPEGAEIFDLDGATIVPGFIDTHFHPQSLETGIHTPQVWQYAATLAWGVTTTRDPQTGSTDVLTYADRVEAGQVVGPRIYSTGPGLGISEPAQDLDHARELLRRYREYYRTSTLKMYMAGNRQQQQWIAMAAQELEIMPTTEGGMDLNLNLTHMLDGYSGIEHNLPIAPLFDDVARLLAESGTVNTPTLLVSYGGPLAMNRHFTAGGLHEDPKVRRFYPHEELDRRTRRRGSGGTGSYGPGGWFHEDEYIYEDMAKVLHRVVEAGGRLGVGGHGEFHGLGYHWELEFMGSGGMAPHDVLRAATIWGAEAIGMAGDLGSIEPGKMADLVILNGNPLEDLRNARDIRFVMKNGRLYDGDRMDEVWPEARPLPRLFREAPAPEGVPGYH